MTVIYPQHLDAPELADFTHLTDVALRSKREPERGVFIAESTQVIRRALAAGHRPLAFLVSPQNLDTLTDVVADLPSQLPVYVLDEPELSQLTGFHLHRGALALMQRPQLADVADVVAGARRIVVLEDLVDHTNVGAAFRSAAALGVDAVLVTARCADPLYRRSVRVSMGTVFQVPWTRIHDWPHAAASTGRRGGIDQLRDLGFTVAALALDADSISLDQLADAPPERLALVAGTEGDGLGKRTIAACDLTVRIPMAGGVDSLNVAAAIAVAAWATRVP